MDIISADIIFTDMISANMISADIISSDIISADIISVLAILMVRSEGKKMIYKETFDMAFNLLVPSPFRFPLILNGLGTKRLKSDIPPLGGGKSARFPPQLFLNINLMSWNFYMNF